MAEIVVIDPHRNVSNCLALQCLGQYNIANMEKTYKYDIWSSLAMCQCLHACIDDDSYSIMSTSVDPLTKLITHSLIVLVCKWSCELFGESKC